MFSEFYSNPFNMAHSHNSTLALLRPLTAARMAPTLFLSRKSCLNHDYQPIFNSCLRKIESKLPHVQASDDVFGEKVWDWNLDAMKNAGVL
jgi:hypothetical protein